MVELPLSVSVCLTVLFPDQLRKTPPSRITGSSKLMPPLSSNEAPVSTTVGAAFVPRAFAVVTRRAPAETVVLPVQLALLPDKIKRPLPSLVRLPIPDRVEAKA